MKEPTDIIWREEPYSDRGLEGTNWRDIGRYPAGGTAEAVGLKIDFQDGPPATNGFGRNGATLDEVVNVALQRVAFINEHTKAATPDYREALDHLKLAREALARCPWERRMRMKEAPP